MNVINIFVLFLTSNAVAQQSPLLDNNDMYSPALTRISGTSTIQKNSHSQQDSLYSTDFSDYFDSPNKFVKTSNQDWSTWTVWSLCSHTCGGGVAMRTRRCGIRNYNDIARSCSGDDIEHRLCNSADCTGLDVDFRDGQCAQHNSVSEINGQFKWTPYYGPGAVPCELSCMAVGFNFYKTFGAVKDGTKCWRDRHDICIDGKCVRVGCDSVLRSNLTEDACGVCGGDNSTCTYYNNIYDQLRANAVDFDYNDIAMIPAGATHVHIRDITNNYLALMEADGIYVKYIINGNWVISWPGDYKIHNNIAVYNRTDGMETITIKGPTTKDLHIMMLYLGGEPYIEYEYWIPFNRRHYETGALTAHKVTQMEPDSVYEGWMDPYEETTTTLPTTTTQTTTVTTTTAATTTTLPVTTRKKAQGGKKKNGKKIKSSKPAYCTPCKRPNNRKKHYCQSDFVIHARVLSKSKVEGKRYRHDINIISVFKSSGFKLMKREYLWVYSSCCPKFRPFRDYMIMGRKRRVLIDNDGRGVWHSANNGTRNSGDERRRYETRLVVDHMDYWHVWKRKYEVGMNKIANTIKCKKMRDPFSHKEGANRDPERRSARKNRRRRKNKA